MSADADQDNFKTRLIAETLEQLGVDAKYAQVRDEIKRVHKITVPESSFYNVRKRMKDSPPPPAKKPAAAEFIAAALGQKGPPPEPAPATPPPAPPPAGGPLIPAGDVPEMMARVRAMVAAFGGKEAFLRFVEAL